MAKNHTPPAAFLAQVRKDWAEIKEFADCEMVAGRALVLTVTAPWSGTPILMAWNGIYRTQADRLRCLAALVEVVRRGPEAAGTFEDLFGDK